VWHFYHVIFDPDVYPVNFAFLDGRVSEEHYREEHQLAYEESLKEDSEEAQATPEPEGPQKPLEAQ
jgi:prepilin-type processing-associated H-X9-DG protein